jgi:mRNA-degrading endonuclease RelE of RelBE toxin-antitoxin system
MISRTNQKFWKAYKQLPEEVRKQARSAYRLFVQDPFHESLHFKRVSQTRALWSVRIGRGYRALGIREDDVILWLWIGSHAEYDKLLNG